MLLKVLKSEPGAKVQMSKRSIFKEIVITITLIFLVYVVSWMG